ncbi:hypothetical protein FQ087_18370 [Sporosarcina sp. ANT_H38]|uniref:hypothetical protein n=1 Tax=Sporosarcina sp. ANT_H38 TaxID=2597358 RepID=UPI0011F16E75|nr:hypothetical protein [Sporosarcina sp. ANT_H38]KAA0944092.1 hypothetical protein FQ087_18370 [Sporosarcina sp. ANT_H38]
MSNASLLLNDPEVIKIYIPLITGVVVFILTSVYNHWRDRVQSKLDKRVHFDDDISKTFFSKLRKDHVNGPIKFLSDGNYESFIDMTKENDFRLEIHRIENIGNFTIFDINVKYRLYTNKVIKKYFLQNKMDPGESFIIPVGTPECPIDTKRHSYSLSYITSGREKFKINRWYFKVKHFTGIQITSKYYFGFIKIPNSIRIRHTKYNTKFIRL